MMQNGIVVAPHIPSDFPQFFNKGNSPTSTSVARSYQSVIVLLKLCPFFCNPSFEKMPPAYGNLIGQ
jgi:hypothetical protein